jgi:hypothetical protein
VLVVLQVDVAETGEWGQKDEGAEPPDRLVDPAVGPGGDGPVMNGGGGGCYLSIYTERERESESVCRHLSIYLAIHPSTCARRRGGA